jgi:argininosuccinate lyase
VLEAAAEEVLGESLTEYVDRETLAATLEPTESVAMRDSRGGPAPEAVAASLDRAREEVAADRSALSGRREAVADAATRRDEEVETYV